MGLQVLTDLYTFCFWFGAAATVLTFVLGLGRFGSAHLPHVGHVGHGPHLGPAGHAGTTGVSPFNLTSLLAFLVVFGAVGLVAPAGLGALVALVLATAAGLVGGWLAFLFVARFLVRGQTFLEDDPIAGTVGRVSRAIAPAHVGEVIYTRNGVRRSDGARALDGQAIAEGEDVVILRYVNGIAVVQRWREFIDGSGGDVISRGDAERGEDAETRMEARRDELMSPPSASSPLSASPREIASPNTQYLTPKTPREEEKK
jgi:hypothetical protein